MPPAAPIVKIENLNMWGSILNMPGDCSTMPD